MLGRKSRQTPHLLPNLANRLDTDSIYDEASLSYVSCCLLFWLMAFINHPEYPPVSDAASKGFISGYG
jgi:hypothetical protein